MYRKRLECSLSLLPRLQYNLFITASSYEGRYISWRRRAYFERGPVKLLITHCSRHLKPTSETTMLVRGPTRVASCRPASSDCPRGAICMYEAQTRHTVSRYLLGSQPGREPATRYLAGFPSPRLIRCGERAFLRRRDLYPGDVPAARMLWC